MDNGDIRLKSVVSQFAAVADTCPDTLAVVEGERCITYGELNRRAILLGEELMRRGIAVEDSVGLLLDRSMELYLGMLAAHKCGACYVPLDPAWPEKRYSFIAEETECKTVLSISSQPVPPELFPKTIFLDQFDWTPSPAPEPRFPPHDLKRLAYILYTSGSTGVPKGVEIEHAGLANFVEWQNGFFPHAKLHRTTQAARPGFDASCSEIWPALCSGSTLYVIPPHLLLNLPALAVWLTDNRIHECFLPTPLAELLMDTGMPQDSLLRVLRTGGDRLTRKPPAGFPAILVNEYGPTECSIVSTWSVFFPGEAPNPPPDVGIPLPRFHILILDEALNPLPDGQSGEICIGGIGLARGYHRRPELNAAAFVSNPANPEEKLYRTGDIGIRNPDGRFQFVGRKDFQIKLRGQRLELGEIEEVISSHPDVAKCVASVRDSASGSKTIAAYVTLYSHSPEIAGELLVLAEERLPEYMVPSSIRILDAFPLTSNGKIDRSALPDPDSEVKTNPEKGRVPERECEKKLAALWQSLLKSPTPGLDDNFFRLGGDSLQAAVLSIRIGDDFQFDSSASLLFEHPKLADLAEFVEKNAGTGVSAGLKRGNDETLRACFPVTSYQLSQWKLQQFSGAGNLNNIVIAIHLDGCVEPCLLKRVLKGIAEDHCSLRSGFDWDGQRLRQKVAPDIGFPLPFHDWSAEKPERRDDLFAHKVDEHRKHCFDLASPPLFRAELVKLEERRYELLFTVCHLVFDGWSGALFFARLRDDYLRLSSGKERTCPGRNAPDYPDFALYHRNLLETGGFRRGLAVWHEMLADFQPMPRLPFERVQSPDNHNAAGRYEFTIPEDLCCRLKRFALESGSTLFTLLQAVLQLQLHKYTGVTDIVTGTAFANRKERNSEGIVGMFINSLPLRHRLNPDESFNLFLQHFGHTVKRCVENSDVPLDLILENTRPASGRNAPLFPVSLLLQNLPWPENSGHELRIRYDELGSGVAKTDLTLVMEERCGVLDCHVEFREAIFSPESIAAFCDAFHIFAGTLLGAPDTPVSMLQCPLPPESRSGVYIIGDTGLVPACGDLLLRKGFYIHGIFSADTPVLHWADGHRIPVYNPAKENFGTVMRRIPFDYLFSIINSHLIGEDILSIPKKMAVNYHDSFLPRYAGLNAVCWAVIHRESVHGITWHRMTAEVDAGDICRQCSVPVSPETTAVQLSFKCSEACIETLSELADEWIADISITTPQDLSKRTCYTAVDRPFAGAMLDWNRTQEEICALVHGLDLGSYENEMACAKFLHNGVPVIVRQAVAVPVSPDGVAPKPGMVTDIDEKTITVAAGNGRVRLSGLFFSSGEILEPASFFTGEDLSVPEGFDFILLDRAYRAAARNEKYWAGILSGLETSGIPLHGWEMLPQGEGDFLLNVPDGLDSTLLFALFMVRLTSSACIYLPLKLSGAPFGALPPDFLLEYLPLRVEADFNRGVSENLKNAGNPLQKLIARHPCPGDIFLRRGKLRRFSTLSPALERDTLGRTRLIHCGGERGERLLKLFNAFCDNVRKHPDWPLKMIRIQSEEDARIEVFDWNNTERNYPLDTSYAALFAERLPGHYDRTAVIAEGGSMSYGELDRRSTRVARMLQASGAVPGDTVGISAVRSLELVCALLGIFKAGCAYLALEPGQFPVERNRQMLETGEAKILLVFEPGTSLEEHPESLTVINLDTERGTLETFPDTPLPRPCDSSANAYIMFTSGSTGTPKGVMVSQRNLLNHNQAVIEAFGLVPEDRMLQFGSLSFDLSVEEIFPILLAGGTLVFRPGRRPPPASELLDFARKERISVFDLPTAYWHSMVDSLKPEEIPPSLRLVVIGGEHASPEHLKRWRELAPGVRLCNTYGPTETTVIATLSENFDTIGTPIGNTFCYILDRFMQPCPPGCPGEIHIGGENVARGYINDPVRTARVFIPDPFRIGGRVYRSGDLGCYTPQGDIVYLGRSDRQVKIRGFRIELESVEAALCRLPGIENAVVVARKSSGAAAARLDAYVTAKNTVLDMEKIRERLAAELPDFMVPSTITHMDDLPVTPTGKVDRNALPTPESPDNEVIDDAPNSTMEMQISLIFKRLLSLNSVDLSQSFFNMGGDSLSALNLCLEVENICGFKLGMEEVYANPSVKGLAGLLCGQRGKARPWSPLVLLADNGGGRPLYLIHTTPGDVFGYVNLAGRLTGRKIYAFQAVGLNPDNEPHRTIPEMAACYVRLLREHQPQGPYSLCGWCFGGIVAYEMACQLDEIGEKTDFLGLIETWGIPPMSPVYLFRLGWNLLKMGPCKWLEYFRMKMNQNELGERPREGLDFIAERFSGSHEKSEIEHLKKIYALNMNAVHHYVMRHYHGKIELFCAELSTFSGIIADPERRWTGLTDDIRLEEISGGSHHEILKPPSVNVVAEKINEALSSADS